MHEVATWLTSSLFGTLLWGVVGNLLASAVMFLLGGRWLWKRHLKPHIQKVHDLHQHMLKDTPQ